MKPSMLGNKEENLGVFFPLKFIETSSNVLIKQIHVGKPFLIFIKHNRT